MSAPIAAPLLAGAVPANGLTFTATSPRRTVIRSACPAVAGRLAERGWRIDIDSRPEHAAAPCKQCEGAHR